MHTMLSKAASKQHASVTSRPLSIMNQFCLRPNSARCTTESATVPIVWNLQMNSWFWMAKADMTTLCTLLAGQMFLFFHSVGPLAKMGADHTDFMQQRPDMRFRDRAHHGKTYRNMQALFLTKPSNLISCCYQRSSSTRFAQACSPWSPPSCCPPHSLH
jgi:hypothetical protein